VPLRIAMRRPVVALALLLSAWSPIGSTQQTQPPQTFRSGVDLILIEATVLDKDGRPIADLQAKDFSIKLGGKPRTVAAAEYIPAGRATAGAPASAAQGVTETTPTPRDGAVGIAREQLGGSDRTFVLAVDVANIRSGAGRNALVNVADYVATLPPTDRIGMVTLPGGGRSVEPTSDRAVIREALSRTAGTDHRMDSCDATIGEAAAEAVLDDRGLAAFGRASPPRCPASTRARLGMFINQYRNETRNTLGALTSLANAMAAIPGRRTLVLVSEGLYLDNDLIQEEMRAFGAALERSRVVLYAIHLDFPFAEASMTILASPASRRLDDRYGFDAMATTAYFGGGTAIRAISRATPAIRQIDTELSGTYLLGIERQPTDVAGKSLELKVDVLRKGTDVRARQNIMITK
jgi:VWFA-related protein